MIKRILAVFLVIPLLFACEAEDEMREFPLIRTLSPVDIDSTGASFRGELVREGISSTSSYGFLWDTGDPVLDGSFKVVLGENIDPEAFTARIDSNLVKGVTYNVRAYATYDDITVYGNNIRFKSNGSKHSPWSAEVESVTLSSWFYYSLGFADEKNGYVLYSNSDSYVFDPGTNEFSRSYSFPPTSATVNHANVVPVNNAVYFFNYNGRSLYKHQDETWTVQSTIPFRSANRYRHVFAVANSLYVLGYGESYRYNMNYDYWEALPSMPVLPVGGTDLNDRAYLISIEKDIWEYDVNTNAWNLKTRFPGILHDRIVTFAYGNRIFFGLSHHDHSQAEWFEREFWSYDLTSDEWELLELFPVDLPSGDLFFFEVSGRLYMGHGKEGIYSIWKFDPSRLAATY